MGFKAKKNEEMGLSGVFIEKKTGFGSYFSV